MVVQPGGGGAPDLAAAWRRRKMQSAKAKSSAMNTTCRRSGQQTSLTLPGSARRPRRARRATPGREHTQIIAPIYADQKKIEITGKM
jgi:hypothetical protein